LLTSNSNSNSISELPDDYNEYDYKYFEQTGAADIQLNDKLNDKSNEKINFINYSDNIDTPSLTN